MAAAGRASASGHSAAAAITRARTQPAMLRAGDAIVVMRGQTVGAGTIKNEGAVLRSDTRTRAFFYVDEGVLLRCDAARRRRRGHAPRHATRRTPLPLTSSTRTRHGGNLPRMTADGATAEALRALSPRG
jgi:hypothetical protein